MNFFFSFYDDDLDPIRPNEQRPQRLTSSVLLSLFLLATPFLFIPLLVLFIIYYQAY
jgi:hypothetical protein